MTQLLAAAIFTGIAVVIAVVFDRLVVFTKFRVKEDIPRTQAALEAIAEQEEDLDTILAMDNVDKDIKRLLVEFSEYALEPSAARIVIACVANDLSLNFDESDERHKEGIDLLEKIDKLEHTDKKAFEIATRLLRRAIVMSVLQWPNTTRAMSKLLLRISDSNAEGTIRSAVHIRRAAAAEATREHLVPEAA